MDSRKTSADFYPGGKTAISAGGGITSGEVGGNGSGVPTVPVTKVSELPERYRESDMRSKINEIARVISGGVAAFAAMMTFAVFGDGEVKVHGAKKDKLWNDDFVVTNVTVDLDRYAKKQDLSEATNALDKAFNERIDAVSNEISVDTAKGIELATNILAKSLNDRLEMTTNGMFDAEMLEPYAKRSWVDAQGFVKSGNMTGYAQVDWVQSQGYVRESDFESMVNNSVAKQDGTSAYRLMSADRSEWIDGTGVCWRATSHVEVDGRHMTGRIEATKWRYEDEYQTVEVNREMDKEDVLWSVREWLRWSDEPENPEVTWNEVNYEYTGRGSAVDEGVVLTIDTEDPPILQGGTIPPETISLRFWTETNVLTRVAFTNDVLIGVSGGLTTNEVCAIVTNEVDKGFTEWRFNGEVSDKIIRMTPFWLDGFWWIDALYSENSGTTLQAAETNESTLTLTVSNSFAGVIGSFTREYITGNALGLATLKDIEGAVTVDKFETNSVYFIDEEIPTMKLFTSYMRSPYWMNRMSAIEIGDKNQVLKTHYLQVDGNLAVNLPDNIRFMSTLDRNAAYGDGRSLSLQDYLDAFNPVFVPETLRRFQTNESDYVIGTLSIKDALALSASESVFDNKVTINNNLKVENTVAVSSNIAVWGKMFIPSWDALRIGWAAYKEDINNGLDVGYQDTLADYVERLVEPLVAATNAYERGESVIEVHDCGSNSYHRLAWVNSVRASYATPERVTFFPRNKYYYRFDGAILRTQKIGVGGALFKPAVNTNFCMAIPSPAGVYYYTGKGSKESAHLDIKILFDLSGDSKPLHLDVGTWNFVRMGESVGADGEWETIYSTVQPTERTETVIHTETYTWYDEYWDDELGEWVYDYDNPHTETYEWYDEYVNNMIFEIQPYTCTEFHFKQVGPKAMKVDIQTLYKTNPVR